MQEDYSFNLNNELCELFEIQDDKYLNGKEYTPEFIEFIKTNKIKIYKYMRRLYKNSNNKDSEAPALFD